MSFSEYVFTDKDVALILSNAYVTPPQFNKLFEFFKSGEKIFKYFGEYGLLTEKLLGKEKSLQIAKNLSFEYLEFLKRKYGECGITVVSVFDEEYPKRLRHIDNSPYLLYCVGDVKLLNNEKVICICGTRRCTSYGRSVAENFVNAFSLAGITVVCGASDGIEAASLKKAIKCDCNVIEILPFGADGIRDAAPGSLIAQIVRKGLVVAELPFGAGYYGHMYAAANRIATGIADGVLLVEAGEGSGALRTCDTAIEQNKELYVVPGGINSTASTGSNALIRSMPECMVTNPSEIIEKFGTVYIPIVKNKDKDNVYNDMSDEERRVFELLENEEMSLNELVSESGLEVSELCSMLSCFEMLGYIEKTPQGRYRKTTEG